MKLTSFAVAFLPLVLVASCGESGDKAKAVVQAATKAAAEGGQQLAAKAAELARLAPEEAGAKLREFVDLAARELDEIKDSETAKAVAAEVESALAKLAELKTSLKINLASLQVKVDELIEKFKNDPRVVSALKALQEQMNKLGS